MPESYTQPKIKEHPRYLPGLGWFAVPPRGPDWGAYMEVLLPGFAALAALLLAVGYLLQGPETFQLIFKILLVVFFLIGAWTEGLSVESVIFLAPLSGVSTEFVDSGQLPLVVYLFLAVFSGRMIGLFSEGFLEGEPALAERRPSFLISTPVFAASGMVLVGYFLFAWRLTEFHGLFGQSFNLLAVNAAGQTNVEAIRAGAAGALSLFSGLAAIYLSMRFDWNRGYKYLLPAFALGATIAAVFAYRTILLGTNNPTTEFMAAGSAAIFFPVTIAVFGSFFVQRGKSMLGVLLLALLLGPTIYLGAEGLAEATTICAAVLALLAMRRNDRFAKAAKYLTAMALIAILTTLFLPSINFNPDSTDEGKSRNIISGMIARFPLTGTGAGSQAFETENEAARFDLTPEEVAGQANLHSALIAETGIFGYGAILLMLGALLIRAFSRKSLTASPPWLFDALIAGVVAAFFVAGRLPPSAAAGAFIFSGLMVGAIESQRAEAHRRDVRRAGFFVVFPMVVSVMVYAAILTDISFTTLDVHARAIEAGRSAGMGIFPAEAAEGEPAMSWMGKKAMLPVSADANAITLELATEMPAIERQPLVMSAYLNRHNIYDEYFYNRDRRRVEIALPPGDGGRRVLTLRSSRTFNPAELQISDDERDLSVKVRIIGDE